MRADRLLKLADFLETVPTKKFDLSDWQTKAPSRPEGKREGECGFAGCAVGWAAHAKLFRGFALAEDETFGIQPFYQGADGWDAVAKLFGIKTNPEDVFKDDTGFLFMKDSYPTFNPSAKQVAARIRAFVKQNAEAK